MSVLVRANRKELSAVAIAGALLLIAVNMLPVGAATPPAFTPGNIVVYRVGAGGAATLVNTGNPIFLDEYTPAGALVQSLALPTTTSGSNHRLIASGTATSEGLLTMPRILSGGTTLIGLRVAARSR